MMSTCRKQHLTNAGESIQQKIKQHWSWTEKKKNPLQRKCVVDINQEQLFIIKY